MGNENIVERVTNVHRDTLQSDTSSAELQALT